MNKGHSLQWKLTLITAFMVIASCLCTSYFVSKSAMLFFAKFFTGVGKLTQEECDKVGDGKYANRRSRK